MFIAHLPAAYLAARLHARLSGTEQATPMILAAMAGGIFPDIDLFYGAWVDEGRVHHHLYWTHLPLVWGVVQAGAVLLSLPEKVHQASPRYALFHVFLLGVWSHLLLDSIAGDIWWLWPWLDTPFSLVSIPAIHNPWWLNYLLHWTFAVEITVVALAMMWEWHRPILPHLSWRPA